MSDNMHVFESGAVLAEALADAVAAKLAAAIAAKGTATLAVSGGSTPKLFFQALSNRVLDWSKVTTTLVDERFVPLEDSRSNHRLVADNLLKDAAAACTFLPLYAPVASAEEAATLATAKAAALGLPFDVVILGMGGDGHTASFFPGGNNLASALDLAASPAIITMEASGAGEPRLTFNFAALHNPGLLVLHIEGQGKKDVLAKAESGDSEEEMPVRAVLRRAASPVEIYWAP